MAVDREDLQLASAAVDNRRAGKKPTKKEAAALRRVEADREETTRWKHYAAIPKKHYLALCGRQSRTVNEQAARYDMPIPVGRDRPTIDLSALLHWLHDFLAENAKILASVEGEDPMSGLVTPMLEKWREEKWRLAKLDRQEREASLLPRETVRELHVRLAGLLRSYGETIQRDRSLDPVELFEECLDDFQRLVDGHHGEHALDDDTHNAADTRQPDP